MRGRARVTAMHTPALATHLTVPVCAMLQLTGSVAPLGLSRLGLGVAAGLRLCVEQSWDRGGGGKRPSFAILANVVVTFFAPPPVAVLGIFAQCARPRLE